MSVVVKGMDAPARCDDACPLFHRAGHETWCGMKAWLYEPPKNWRDVCPIKQMPKEHGRLIDADELADKCDEPHWCVWLNEITDAPTIIEAEGEE